MRFMWLLLALALPTSAAFAEDKPGRHTHDGFYLRTQFGFGYTHSEAPDAAVVLKGGAASINVELGYAVFNNFILYGKLFGANLSNPDLKVGNISIDGDEVDDATAVYSGFGGGATYYFMPINIYASAAVVGNRLSVSRSSILRGSTDVGVGLHLGVGKEWWVSGNWGLGLGGELAMGRIRDPHGFGTWNITHFSLVFSATYN